MASLQELYKFVDTAQRNRRYPPNTASGKRAALRLFEAELRDEEKESLDTFRRSLDQIYQGVYQANKDKMTVATLLEYKRRVLGLLNDFDKYGTDPTKMASWNPVPRIRQSKKKENGRIADGSESQGPAEKILDQGPTMVRFEFPLRQNVKAIVLTPSDMTIEEAKKIKAYIEYLESTAGK